MIATMFPVIAEYLRKGTKATGVAKKTSSEDKKPIGKTRKGATHRINPTFRSRQIMAVTPAQYRERHMGKKRK